MAAIPCFLVDSIVSFGVRRETVVSVHPGDQITAGPLSISVPDDGHFRTGTKVGAEAIGYLISSDNAPTVAFPGDVRDFAVKESEALNADHCFAHVWLTDHALEPTNTSRKAVSLPNLCCICRAKAFSCPTLTLIGRTAKDVRCIRVYCSKCQQGAISRNSCPHSSVR